MGRKTKLTPELQTKICDIIAQGNYISTACLACGISERAYFSWMSKGEKGNGSSEGIYKQFVRAVKKAEAQAQSELVGTIKKASKTTWQASAWLLERKQPGMWGQRPIEHKLIGDIIVRTLIPRPEHPEIEGKEPVKELKEGEDTDTN